MIDWLNGILFFQVLTTVFMLGYSVYTLYLSWKQARVLEEIQRTNQLLEDIKEKL